MSRLKFKIFKYFESVKYLIFITFSDSESYQYNNSYESQKMLATKKLYYKKFKFVKKNLVGLKTKRPINSDSKCENLKI